MKQIYNVTGMTCNGCLASVKKHLHSIDGVENVEVSLESGIAQMDANRIISVAELNKTLPEKFQITSKEIDSENVFSKETVTVSESKLKQLKPLFLILGAIVLMTVASNHPSLKPTQMMLDYMGYFFIVFSLFKFLDLQGFAQSFSMYDPLAKVFKPYALAYPFIEVVLGVLFLMRVEVPVLLVLTLVVLGITTIGVTLSLLSKKTIQCACLGTVLKLPMTQATFIENAIMLLMAGVLISKTIAL